MKTGGIICCASIILLISFISCSTKDQSETLAEKPYYSEQYRPQFHFTPDSMWMNDPNVDPGIEFGFVLENEAGQTVVAGINPASEHVFIDRSNSGNSSFSDQFAGRHSVPIQISKDSTIRFHAFLDLSSMELFMDGGSVVLTELVFPKTPFRHIKLYSNNGSVELRKGTLHELNGAW